MLAKISANNGKQKFGYAKDVEFGRDLLLQVLYHT